MLVGFVEVEKVINFFVFVNLPDVQFRRIFVIH